MSRLRSSKLWMVLRRKFQAQPQTQPAVTASTPNNTKLPIEILELIFAHLDIFTLLRCRTICHSWHQCIPGTSPSLRSILFLTNPYLSTRAYTLHQPAAAPLEFIIKFAPDFAKVTEPQPATEYTVQTAPIMTLNGDSGGCYEYNPLLFFAITQPKLRRYRTILSRAAKGEAELPLWMSMYVTSPPVRTLALRLDFHGTRIICDECWVQQHRTGAVVEDHKGVTVGKVLEKLCEALWWPDLILSETGNRGGVRVIAREEGERVEEEEEEEEERRRVGAAVKKAEEVRLKKSFLPRFGWEE